jgi:hypothetical protein
MNTSFKTLALITLTLFVLTLSACGGSSGSDPSPPANTTGETDQTGSDETESPGPCPGTGRFENITGLAYATRAGQVDYTENGYFDYEEGDVVAFFLNGYRGVIIGYALARPSLTIDDLAVDGAWISAETAENIRTFLEALDIDDDPSNGITLTAAQRDRARENLDVTLPRHRFIRQYADYARYIAGDSGATGDIGQTDEDRHITLARGVSLFLPINLFSVRDIQPAVNESPVLNTLTYYDDHSGPIKNGLYLMGADPGVEQVVIPQDGYEITFTVTVVEPETFGEFTGTTIDFFDPLPNVSENVSYARYLETTDALGVVDTCALIYLDIIFEPGEY